MDKALTTGTMNTDVMIMPDYSGMAESTSMSTVEPERMSPMDSLMAIFEDMRDSLNTLVDLAYAQAPTAADMRDEDIAEADVIPDPAEPDSQGNSSFKFEKPEIGPKVGLTLMLLGLSALFQYGDEIAAALEPILKYGKEFYDSLSPEGKIGLGMAGLAALIFPETLTSIVKTGLGLAFDGLKLGFSGMKTAVEKMPDLIKNAYTGGKNLIMGAFDKLKTGFQLMRVFLIEKAYPAILSAFGGVKGKLFSAITKLGAAFTALRLFLLGTLIPAITAIVAPFAVPIAIAVAAVAAAVAIFYSIRDGIQAFKDSLAEGDSMLVAIIKGVSTALLTLVTLPITLIKNFVAWVAGKLGFEGIAEKLKEFSIVDFIKDGVKNLVLKAKDFILGLFDLDFNEALGKFIDIGKAIMDSIKAIGAGALSAAKGLLTPIKSFKKGYDKYIKGDTTAEPEAEEFDIDADMTQGEKVAEAKLEIKENEAEIKLIKEIKEQDDPEFTGTNPKIAALEAKNVELLKFIADNSLIQSDIAKKSLELQGTNSGGGGNVITTVNNTDASNTNNTSNNTTNTSGLAVTGTDSTAKALSDAGYGVF